MRELLIGLPEINVRGAHDEPGGPISVHVESRLDQGWCRDCEAHAAVKDRAPVEFVDLPCFGRPTRLVWHKQRWWRQEGACPAGSWTIVDERIAWPRATLSDGAYDADMRLASRALDGQGACLLRRRGHEPLRVRGRRPRQPHRTERAGLAAPPLLLGLPAIAGRRARPDPALGLVEGGLQADAELFGELGHALATHGTP